MNLSIKQKHSWRNRHSCGYQEGGGWGGAGVGDWGQELQAFIYRKEQQQSPTVQHRGLCSVSYDKP